MKVRIYKPSKNAMQSGRAKIKSWLLECETATARQPESLMGWTASGDTLNQIKMYFHSAEDAVAYAEEQGWQYTVAAPKKRSVRPRSYMDNFKYESPAVGSARKTGQKNS
jgi:hypothetical protein